MPAAALRNDSSYICTNMQEVLDKLNETVAFIRTKYPYEPEIGIVLGSGLGNFLTELKVQASISYHELPHFPLATVEGHDGKLVFGELSGKKIMAMAGRFHYYEGYSPDEVIYPIRTMKLLGVRNLLLSNAAGGVNTTLKVGDLMIIKDHISLFVVNPLLGRNNDTLGSRFPDMSEPYSRDLIIKAKEAARELNMSLKEGVYFGVTGPTFETHAEYRMIERMGADAVGMSTVQETIAGVHLGLRVFAISVITDMGIREDDSIITHEEVLEAARHSEPKLTALFKELVGKL
jgi:purine-nucleoside phosphorylase